MDYKSLGVKELRVNAIERGMSADDAKASKKADLVRFLTSGAGTIRHVSAVTSPPKALSLFSGAGGDTCGLEAAGWNVSHFSEFNTVANATHKAAHPTSQLLTGAAGETDIKKVPDATFAALKDSTDLIFAGHPCFVAGTQVLTDCGYKAIEDVTLSDYLMTHLNRFQPILNCQQRHYVGHTMNVAAAFHTEPIVCTPSHPFYARKGTGPPAWFAAKDLTYEHQLASLSSLNNTQGIDEHAGETDGLYTWYEIKMVSWSHTGPQGLTVYNFEVETDNSYIVENVVVHNCQGFSHAGKKRTDDPRNELVHEFVRATRLIQPTWIVGENVKGLLSRKGVFPEKTAPRPVIDIIRELFEAVGYKLTYRIVDATEVGVPQLRKRLIYVGHKGTMYPHLPWEKLPTPAEKPTIRALLTSTLEGAMELPALYKPAEQPARFWIPTTESAPSGSPHTNLVRLVGGFRNLSTKEKTELGHTKTEKVPHIEPGGLISFGVRKSGYHGQVLDPDAPSKTIICTYNLCPRLFVGLHNAATGKYWIRCLTPAECAAIQGFPADYAWTGSAKERIIQIGNAVPPPLATAIARLISEASFSTMPQVSSAVASDDSDSEDEGAE